MLSGRQRAGWANVLWLLCGGAGADLAAQPGRVFGPETFVRGSGEPVDVARNFTAQDLTQTFLLSIDNGSANAPRVSDAVVTLNGMRIVARRTLERRDQTARGNDDEPVAVIQKILTLWADNQLVVRLGSEPGNALSLQITGNHTFVAFGPENFASCGDDDDHASAPRTFSVPNPATTWFLRIINGGLSLEFGRV